MTNTLILNHPLARTTEAALRALQNILMLVGAFFVLATAYVYIGKPDLSRFIGNVVPGLAHAAEAEEIAAEDGEMTPANMDARLQAAMEYSARRYRVSPQALAPIFKAAQENGKEHGLDPLLIISVIAVESSFNPLSESNMGAQGLMQVIPRWHREKIPADAGEAPLFDPVINVAVGSKVLKEYVRRHGSVTDGLLQFNGSLKDPSQAYAKKVLAVKERMESASRRSNNTNV